MVFQWNEGLERRSIFLSGSLWLPLRSLKPSLARCHKRRLGDAVCFRLPFGDAPLISLGRGSSDRSRPTFLGDSKR